MTDRHSGATVPAAFAFVLFIAGCQSGGSHRADVKASPALASPVLASLAPMAATLNKGVSEKSSFSEQFAQPRQALIAQVSATEFVDGRHKVRKVEGVDTEVLPAPAPSLSEPTLSLQDAIATSLTQNPDLIAARGQDQVSAAAVDVAATYPWNPFVQAQLRPSDGRGGQTNYYVWLMQRFELAHQRNYREQNAEATLNQVRWTIHQTELMNISQTARLYFSALYQKELYELANQTAELNEELLGIVERRFKAGVGTAAQVTTAKVAARQSRNQARLADATYQAALLALRQQLNLPASEPLKLVDSLPAFYWQTAGEFCNNESPSENAHYRDLSQLAGELVAGRPDVMAALAGVNAAGANYRLANAARIPDVQAGPIFDQNPNGSSDLGVRLQMDLPVWNTGAPLARQRDVEWQQQNRVYTQLKTRAAREAEMAIDRYERARRLATESKVDLSPFTEKMPADLKEINAQFQAGQADVLSVFATQNSLLQDRRTYLDLLNELAQSAAGVVQATALPVERIVSFKDGPSRP